MRKRGKETTDDIKNFPRKNVFKTCSMASCVLFGMISIFLASLLTRYLVRNFFVILRQKNTKKTELSSTQRVGDFMTKNA
jgi:hypothetical protein